MKMYTSFVLFRRFESRSLFFALDYVSFLCFRIYCYPFAVDSFQNKRTYLFFENTTREEKKKEKEKEKEKNSHENDISYLRSKSCLLYMRKHSIQLDFWENVMIHPAYFISLSDYLPLLCLYASCVCFLKRSSKMKDE